jgi:two-component system chemotaxis response regulator CheY
MNELRVLVADDDTSCRMVLRATVERLGHECRVAADGDEAWRLFEEEQPDVLITDWMMPGLDGPELCRRVRHHEADGYTYVILATALGEHENVLEGMEAGADDYLTKPISPFDVRARLVAAKRVTELHKELDRLHAELTAQARTDALTGLGNRLRLHEDLEAIHDRAVRYGHTYCVGICDLDDFKRFNDTYGHQAGDDALRKIGALLNHESRAGDSAYRYGGEEFLIVLAGQSLPQARAVLERIREAVEALAIPHRASRSGQAVTISVGVSAWEHEQLDTPAAVLARADRALYESKAAGRNRVTSGEHSGITPNVR